MLRWIAVLGGVLIMMGQHSRSESLFYYFRVEDHIPDNHLLRLIDRHISFDFVRAKLKDSDSEIRRPSIAIRNCCCGFCWSAICAASQ
jgi:hypothetical protein